MNRLASFSFLLALVGCAASPSADATGADDITATSCEATAVPPGARDDVLFDQHPASGTFVTSKGAKTATPLHVFDDDVTVLYGFVDPAKIGNILDGTGYAPLRLSNGRALARLYYQDYRDTALGPYRELVVGIDVGPVGAPLDLEYVNEYSLITPALVPQYTMFVHKIALDHEVATDYGRELLGFDKVAGKFGACRATGKNELSVGDASGASILGASIGEDDSPAAQMAFAVGFAAALHLQPDQLPPFPEINVMTSVTRDVLDAAKVKKHTYTYRSPAPFYTPWRSTDAITFGRSTELGRTLDDLHFEPKLVYRDKHLRFSIELTP